MNQQNAYEVFKRLEPRVKKDFERYQKAQAELKNLAPKLAEVHKMLSDIYIILLFGSYLIWILGVL